MKSFYKSEGSTLYLMLLYPAVMALMGFLPATSLFLFFMARSNQKSLSYSLIFGLLTATSVYALLFFLLGKSLPLGLFIRLLEY
ncbi:hypothetical protein [Pelobacter seleniigenes]|uniref:hypothetical protein n=1 Tax=Pelobacter seleniigenes TaxID=407188 RepID=UPI0012B9C76A|nr:hypothetical protein [Pelobacter seleniigenes]